MWIKCFQHLLSSPLEGKHWQLHDHIAVPVVWWSGENKRTESCWNSWLPFPALPLIYWISSLWGKQLPSGLFWAPRTSVFHLWKDNLKVYFGWCGWFFLFCFVCYWFVGFFLFFFLQEAWEWLSAFKFQKYLEILRWKLWGSEQFTILIVRFDLSSQLSRI